MLFSYFFLLINTIFTIYRNTVVEDAIAWEKGGQWLFSCYAPLLRRLVTLQQCNETCLPGLIDFSPEEIRWETYKCFQVSGSLDHMLTQLARLAELYSIKRRALQNMDNATVDFIVSIMNFFFTLYLIISCINRK